MDMSHIEWRKASYSTSNGGACVEVGAAPAEWRKASYSSSNGGDCVEVSTAPRFVAVRDSKNPSGPKLAFTRRDWAAFTGQLKEGRYDLT
jgi:hypothetical protein